MKNRRLLVLMVAGAAALVVVAALGFALRAHLAHVPVIGRWIGTAAPAELYVCPMHPEVTSATPGTCPKCGMDLVRAGAEGAAEDHSAHEGPEAATDAGPPPDPRAPVLLDLRRQQLIGVRLASVTRTDLATTIRAVGTVQFDETRLADVNVRVEGFVRDLFVDATGQRVERGQPLFTLYSPDLLTTEQEYLLALRTQDQMRSSANEDARQYAERLAAAARQRLALWDLAPSEIQELERSRVPRDTVTFRSPAAGVVVEKRVVQGQRVMAGESLYRLADLSTVWVEADVYERDLAAVRPGQSADVTVDAWAGQSFSARVVLIAPALDASTRTARVRLALTNPGTRLRPGMFANVEFPAARTRALAVPADAIVDSGIRRFVFVSQGDGLFLPTEVETGMRSDGRVEIRRGLEEGQQVAGAAAFFIDSESQLRAAMQGYEDVPPPSTPAGAEAPASLRIDFRTDPDPPRNGDNMFVVTVRTPDGAAVTDADVSVRLFMAPMPSMNMPAMRTDVTLLHNENGEYHGHGNVSMGGRWDVTVTVSRSGQRLGSKTLGMTAR